MAYLNEFPHTEADKLNLDWILEQYSTFNKRLEEIVQHFDESVAQMEGDIEQYKGEYEHAFEEYKSQITHLIEDFETQVQQESYNVERTIETITNNMTEYVGEHIADWQIQSTKVTCPVSSYVGNVTIDIDPEEHELVIDMIYFDNTVDNHLLRYPQPIDVAIIERDLTNHKYKVNITLEVASVTAYIIYHII